MDSPTQHLAKMANQIATFFASQSKDDPDATAHSIATHLRLFWAPSMRHQLIEAFDRDQVEGLDPLVAGWRTGRSRSASPGPSWPLSAASWCRRPCS